MAETTTLTGVLEHIDDDADKNRLTFGEIVSAFGGRGYGPILLALALIEILPTGAIPGVPTLVGALIVLVAGQLVAGREAPWIPAKLAKKGFSREKLQHARERIKPATKKIDKVLKPRLCQLTTPMMARLVGGFCVILALTMPPLELFPFASSAPSAAIALFALGLSTRDGLLILLGLISTLAVIAGMIYLFAF